MCEIKIIKAITFVLRLLNHLLLHGSKIVMIVDNANAKVSTVESFYLYLHFELKNLASLTEDNISQEFSNGPKIIERQFFICPLFYSGKIRGGEAWPPASTADKMYALCALR